MIVINDVHIGFRRTGGTTPESQEALRSYLFSEFATFLNMAKGQELAIVGDLFDDFEIAPRDWLQTYGLLSDFLDNGGVLILVAGNHDWAPRANRVSCFEMLAKVLQSQFANVVLVGIDQVYKHGQTTFVAHCSNQDIFEAKLKEVWEECKAGDRIFLHANFDNNFAAQSDHSLNVSRELAKSFISHGATLIFAHEHQHRTSFAEEVLVLGNQWPTSIIDCLGNDEKWGYDFQGSVSKISTWTRNGSYGYREFDWREIPPTLPEGFVRITGKASSGEASEVIDVIAKLRRSALPTTFVIGNAVKVEGLIEVEQLPDQFEAAKRFDVMEFISQHMDAAEMKAINELLEKTA